MTVASFCALRHFKGVYKLRTLEPFHRFGKVTSDPTTKAEVLVWTKDWWTTGLTHQAQEGPGTQGDDPGALRPKDAHARSTPGHRGRKACRPRPETQHKA